MDVEQPQEATLIILAGGESRRMGRPKQLLPTAEGTVVDHLCARLGDLAAEVLVVGRSLTFRGEGLRSVQDVFRIHSPLVGIYSGLLASRTGLAAVVACDMPYVSPGLLRLLLDRSANADVVVPVVEGYYEPLCAVYRRSAAPVILESILHGRLKVSDVYERLRVHEISEREVRSVDPSLRSFTNLNTLHDLELAAGQISSDATGFDGD